MTATPPAAVVDALNSLLEAEKNSIFAFMNEGSLYLQNTPEPLRHELQTMSSTKHRHARETKDLIRHLGGRPTVGPGEPDEPMVEFLSLKFLLPKLVDAKKLCMQRYQNTIKTISPAPDDVNAVLKSHLNEMEGELKLLESEEHKVNHKH